MPTRASLLKRRAFLNSAMMAAAGWIVAHSSAAATNPRRTIPLFDGRTLQGWVLAENNATSLSGSDISDLAALAQSIATKQTGASTGTARTAVAQPVGSNAIEVLNFHDPSAGKAGPVAWQMHNAGLFDEHKDITIEIDPEDFELTTVA
jgi:hypothetical protein